MRELKVGQRLIGMGKEKPSNIRYNIKGKTYIVKELTEGNNIATITTSYINDEDDVLFYGSDINLNSTLHWSKFYTVAPIKLRKGV